MQPQICITSRYQALDIWTLKSERCQPDKSIITSPASLLQDLNGIFITYCFAYVKMHKFNE